MVVMLHEPDPAGQVAQTKAFGLQVSGHTHGGQINLPILGPLDLPTKGRMYVAGLYQVGGMPLYVNRGIGMINVPVRVNAPPEITVFRLEGA